MQNLNLPYRGRSKKKLNLHFMKRHRLSGDFIEVLNRLNNVSDLDKVLHTNTSKSFK